jgi:hypothetical protein
MLIVLITSALVVFSLAREKIDSPVVLLKNIYPPVLYSQASVRTKQRMDFSMSLAARRNMEVLEVQYSTLVQTDPIFVRENVTTAGIALIAEAISPISTLSQATDSGDLPPEVTEVQASIGNLSYRGLFYDFPVGRLYSHPSISPEVYTSFLVLEDQDEVLYFEGISDFFLHRLGGYVDIDLPEEDQGESSIAQLRIRRNSEVVSYSSSVDAPSGWKEMSGAPEFGRVTFNDVRKDDTFSVDFTVEIPKRPQKWSAQVIRIYADGELSDILVNIIE